MNDLSIGLMRSALQVTLLTLVTTGVYLLVGRRRPGAAASVATLGLVASMGLTIVACCPLPNWWVWQASSTQAMDTESSSTQPTELDANSLGAVSRIPLSALAHDGLSISTLWSFVSRVEKVPQWCRCSNFLPATFLAIVLLGLAWLGLGIRSIQLLLRGSRPVTHSQLLNKFEMLKCSMGVSRTVGLFESSDVTTAATVGWRKPTLLLSNDWAEWSDEELTAVLAHELAHVLRGDYATWMLATLSIAVHFYHPLVYWLANRLKLQQELAADALGALHAGGASIYRKSLARMALRQECSHLPGPARAFLPAQGTLLRRIAMLREEDVARHSTSSWNLRFGLFALFGLVALALSAIRLPAQQNVTDQSPRATPATARRTEFNRLYLPQDADGLLSFRPAEILARPEIGNFLNQYRTEVNSQVTMMLTTFGISDARQFPRIEEIEQISTGFYLGFHPELKNNRPHSLTMYGITIRTIDVFDWKKLIESLPKTSMEFTKVEHSHNPYFKLTKSPFPVGEMTLCLLVPDSRTLVIDTEKNIQSLLDSKQPREVPWSQGWNRISRSLIAITMANENNRYGTRLKDDPAVTPEYAELLKNIQQFAFGIDGQEELTLDLRAQCVNADAAASVNDSVRKGLALADTFLGNPKADASTEQLAAMLRLRTVLKALQVTRVESEVGAQATLKMTLWELLKLDGGQ